MNACSKFLTVAMVACIMGGVTYAKGAKDGPNNGEKAAARQQKKAEREQMKAERGQKKAAREQTKAQRDQTKAASKAAANSQVLQSLDDARKLLVAANYDYKGHRAQASHTLENVMKGLGYKPGSDANKSSATGSKRSNVYESQSISDDQLRQSKQQLQTLLPQLQGNEKKAVDNALGQIDTALSIR